MAWLSVNLSLPSASVEIFSDLLLELGAIVIDIDPASNQLRALFKAETNVAEALDEAARRSGLATSPHYSAVEVVEQDWIKHVQSQFQPMRITPRLYIVPSWSSAPEPNAVNLTLDPGLAFGTGSHPTTRLCLSWLADVIRGGEVVVDYGCGSGILAISALKLGAPRAIGVDIEHETILAARENARRNRVEAVFCLPRECPKIGADIRVANILLQPLLALAPDFAAMTQGRIALAGIMAAESDELGRRYEEWFVIDGKESEEGWVLMTGTRK